jgi:hypothetical protein
MLDPLLSALLLAWLTACAQVHGVDPAFAQAVMITESRPAGGADLEFRVGRLGKSRYFGPFGIEKSFLKKWDIANPFVNVEVGVKALRGKDQTQVLRRYNPTATLAYIREVRRLTRKLKGGGGIPGFTAQGGGI